VTVAVIFAFPDEPLGDDSLPTKEASAVTVLTEVTRVVTVTTFGGSAGMELLMAGRGGDDDSTGAGL
jgi:hypothetical protein